MATGLLGCTFKEHLQKVCKLPHREWASMRMPQQRVAERGRTEDIDEHVFPGYLQG